jgi:hypothetical protein
MFLTVQKTIPVSFPAARARLVNLAAGNALEAASRESYHAGQALLLRVGPVPTVTRLVTAHFREVVDHGDVSVLTLRWEAAGAGAGLFPALDADITLTAAVHDSTVMRLDGTYRPPLGHIGAGLDRAVMSRIAEATVRSFVNRIADAISNPEMQAGIVAEPRPAPESA